MATPTYIKPSIVNKIVPPKNTEPNIQNQVADIKKQYGNLSTEELYSAMLSVKPPAEQDILQAVGKQYGYLDRLDGLREQAWAIQRKMLSDQTPMFSAVWKDGKPVDPRIITSQFQENMTRDIQRLNQIQKVQDTYKAEMQAIAGAISDQYKSKAQETQTAIQFLQQLNQEKNADRSYNLQKDQLEESKRQNKAPKWQYDEKTGKYVNMNTDIAPDLDRLRSWATASELLSVPDGTVIPTRLKETTNPNGGKECAEFINDVTKLGMGDSYASKVDKTNTQIASEAWVGNVAVWNPNPKDPTWSKYGHAWVITKDLGDSWEIRSSNLHGDGAVTTDIVPKRTINSYNTKVNVVKDIQATNDLSSRVYDDKQKSVLTDFAKKSSLTEADREELKRLKLEQADISNYRLQNRATAEWSPTLAVIWREFVEWKSPNSSVLESLANSYGLSQDETLKAWVQEYLKGKNTWLKNAWFEIKDTAPYLAASDTDRANLSKGLDLIPEVVKNIDRYKYLLDQYGWELINTTVRSEMDQLYKDILLSIKGEALYNLGVLQKIDLDQMEPLVPSAPRIFEWNESEKLGNLKDLFISKVKAKWDRMGIEYVWEPEKTTSNTNLPEVSSNRFTGSGWTAWSGRIIK